MGSGEESNCSKKSHRIKKNIHLKSNTKFTETLVELCNLQEQKRKTGTSTEFTCNRILLQIWMKSQSSFRTTFGNSHVHALLPVMSVVLLQNGILSVAAPFEGNSSLSFRVFNHAPDLEPEMFCN